METAINIGFSCSLLTKNMLLIVVKGTDAQSTQKQITDAIEQIWGSDTSDAKSRLLDAAITADVPFLHVDNMRPMDGVELALIIDGQSLKYALQPEIRMLFLELGCRCKVILFYVYFLILKGCYLL